MLQNTIGTTDDVLVHFAVPFLKSRNQFPFGFGLTADFMTSTPWALKKMLKHLPGHDVTERALPLVHGAAVLFRKYV